jgi:hypothetical protein
VGSKDGKLKLRQCMLLSDWRYRRSVDH